MNEMLEKAKVIENSIVADRHSLHQIPEVGLNTPKSAAYVSGRLDEMGIPNRSCGIHRQEDRDLMAFAGYPDAPASTGVVGLIGHGGPCFMLRADMDGLPVKEDTGLPFASKNGCGHMCGHDAHTAMLLGAARILKDMEASLPGTVKLMFQPGEEMGYGSRTMIEDGLLENPTVQAAMGLHVNPQLEVGKLTYSPTVTSGSMATFFISIQGRGGHSSEPNKTIDPVHIATQLTNALNLIIPREVDPDVFATLTVGSLHGGTASNIVPDKAEIAVSFRTLSPVAYEHLLTRVAEVSEAYVSAWRGTCSMKILKTPGTVCNETLSTELAGYAAQILGSENIRQVPPMKGAEDFAHVAARVPGFFAFIGAGGPDHYPWHNPHMTLDERVLPLGASILASCAVQWLKAHS